MFEFLGGNFGGMIEQAIVHATPLAQTAMSGITDMGTSMANNVPNVLSQLGKQGGIA